MIMAGEFRNGITFEVDNQVFQVIEFQHVKPGKGAAFVRTRLKNVITGATVDRTFSPNDKMPKAHIDRRDMQYLYNDGELFHFMDSETFDQVPMNADTVGDTLKFVKENDTVKVLSFKGAVFGIEAATFVILEIIETEPGFKGDTAQGATKPATVETGAVVKVPLFVDAGEKIKIDTRTGEYLERA
ncbi:MAG: elongation factor P [Bacillota bacterium]